MKEALTEAIRVYADEGLIQVGTKATRKVLRPVLGENKANQLFYRLNNALINKTLQPSEFTINRNIIGIEEDGYNSFVGFYDCTPFGPDNNRVLYHRTPHQCRPDERSNPLELCYFDIATCSTQKIGETTTWNWQKGSRLQWLPGTTDKVIYNTEVDGGIGAEIYDLRDDTIDRRLEHPIYALDPDGAYAISLNYARLERLHPDYGYTNVQDVTKGKPTPADDGLYRVDLSTGERELIVSYQQMAELTHSPFDVEQYAMNLMVNPTGDRVVFLHRYYQEGTRMTNLFCASTDGTELTLLLGEDEASHPIWLSEYELLTTVNEGGIAARSSLVVFDTASGEKREINLNGLGEDTHPTPHPTKSHVIVGDTYPQATGHRYLFEANLAKGTTERLGSVYGPVFHGVKRDLHPRWDREGKYLCIDLPRPGNRQAVYLIEMGSSP